jgi:putative glutamine amidotransferase
MNENIASCKDAESPRIAVVTRLNEKGAFYLRREYCEALAAFGATPLLVPLIRDAQYLEFIVETSDGLLLPGSDSDIDPLLYGEEPLRHLGRVQPARDEVDLRLLSAAEKKNLPVLGICFGMQSLNVSRGGTLWQDIFAQVPNAIQHQQEGESRERAAHSIWLEANSFLAKICEKNRIKVNTHHHQAIKDLGENLRIAARAADQIIEAVEDVRPDRFVLGVQWHPELVWTQDEFSQNIFRKFVCAARNFKQISCTEKQNS